MRSTIRSIILLLCAAAAGFAQSGAPTIDPNRGVENAGNLVANESLAPGSFVSIFGTNFTSSLTLADTIPLSTSLANVSVTFNNVPAPIMGVGHNATPDNDDRINAQLPWEALGGAQSGTAQVVITVNGTPSAPVNVNIVPAAPGLMILAQDSIGVFRPVAYNNSDNTLAYPVSAFPGGLAVRAAKVNDPSGLVLLATGLGAVTLTPPDGSPATQNGQMLQSNTVNNPVVLVGSVPAQVVFSGLSQYPSLYQINIVLDPSTPAGDAVPVIIQMNGLQSRPDLMIAVTH